MIEASCILPGLYVGSRPPRGVALYRAGFHCLVLCACDHQPPEGTYQGLHVMRIPLRDDGTLPSSPEVERASHIALAVADMVKNGHQVLLTCNHGRNRSALVAALAVTSLLGCSGSQAASMVRRRRRSPYGATLTNGKFHELLSSVPGASTSAGRIRR